MAAEKRDDSVAKINGRMVALAKQRDNALNDAVGMAGELAGMGAEIADLKKQLEEQERELAALRPLVAGNSTKT